VFNEQNQLLIKTIAGYVLIALARFIREFYLWVDEHRIESKRRAFESRFTDL